MPIEPESDLETLAETEVAYVVPPPAYQSIDTEEGVPLDGAIPEAAPEPATPVSHESLAAFSESISSKLESLKSQFDREVRAEAAREKILDRLHAELQEYKNGLLLGIMRPVFVDLIQLHDDIGKMIDATTPSDGEVSRLIKVMRGFQQGVIDILYRQGVEPYQVEGDVFDPRRQRAIATLTIEDAELNKRVAARHRPGFLADHKVIRPEVVTVYSVKRQV